MSNRVLITGGAGFIGSKVALRALQEGWQVTILDNFSPQIHGDKQQLSSELAPHVRLVRGDVRDESAWKAALVGQDVIVHLAAETGTGQSMYQAVHYTDVNIVGTSRMLELLLSGNYQVRTVVVASSRAVYGEGAYSCGEHGLVYPSTRPTANLEAGEFEPTCPFCHGHVVMRPTSENAPLRPVSLYGVTKQVQEQLTLMYAATLRINGFALRFQNVFGPGQSLKNPYTGILAIFSNQARANKPIYIFEDGKESRDFVYIDDVVEATICCVKAPSHVPIALNVGSGIATPVTEVVQRIVDYYGSLSEVSITGAFRYGDIRHNCADVQLARNILGFQPRWTWEQGIKEFLAWTETEEMYETAYERSLTEMRQNGLMHG